MTRRCRGAGGGRAGKRPTCSVYIQGLGKPGSGSGGLGLGKVRVRGLGMGSGLVCGISNASADVGHLHLCEVWNVGFANL